MPLSGLALGRYGSRLPTAFLALIFPVVMVLPIVAPSVALLFVASFIYGAGFGSLDVAMNMQASEVETARARPTMSSFHGFFSVGTFIGSSLGGLIIAVGWGNGGGALLCAVGMVAVAIWARRQTRGEASRTAKMDRASRFRRWRSSGSGLIPFLSFACEGAVTDWSALFLSNVKVSGDAAAASGVIAFSVAMVAGRLTGDWIVARLGGFVTVAAGGLLVAAGMIIAVFAPNYLLAALGFAIVGGGAAEYRPRRDQRGSACPGHSARPRGRRSHVHGLHRLPVFPPTSASSRAISAWPLRCSWSR